MNQTRIRDYLNSRHERSSDEEVSQRERSNSRMSEEGDSGEEIPEKTSEEDSVSEDTQGHGSHVAPKPKDSWAPTQNMFMEMFHQQQAMMKAMTSLVPDMSSEAGRKRNIPAALGAPPKKQKGCEQDMSEGEISDTFEDDDNVSYKMGKLLEDSDKESEEDIYKDIKDFFSKDEKLGPEVSGATAELVEAVMRSSVSHAKEKELAEKIVRPSNCEALQVPRINPEIWKELKRETKDGDLGLQRTQTLLNKGLTPLVQVMDRMSQNKDREGLRMLGESLRLLALASSQLSQKRKENVAPDLAPQYRQVCSASRPVTQLLFGDELNKTLRELKDTQSVGTKLSVTTNTTYRGSYRGRSYRNQGTRGEGSYRGQQQKSRNFLGGRAPHHGRKRGQGRPQSPPKKR